jgi:ribulose-5-phosphate 4-epimerase/fuculose-1-phosphate aldolase
MGKMTQGLELRVQADGLSWPAMPSFASKEDERLHGKRRLACAFRIFAHYGFDSGIGGHITYRDPLLNDHFWVNPLGVHFSRIRVSDLVLIRHDGQIVEGRHPVNAAAYAIHSSIHKARPDVIAAAHSHSRFGTTFATLGKRLPTISQESCSFYRDHGLYDGYEGVAGQTSEGELIGRALGPHKAVICRNHGLFTVGHSVDEAAFWFIRMERACEQSLRAWAAGSPVEIDDAIAARTVKQVGSHPSGWYSIQPLMDKFLAEQPDLLQ